MSNKKWEEYIPDFAGNCISPEYIQNFLQEANRKLLTAKENKFLSVASFSKSAFPFNDLSDTDMYFGYFENPVWRKCVLSIFLADVLSYPKQGAQVDFFRLLYILNMCPQNFSVWWVTLSDGTMIPVGYTAYYYVSGTIFTRIEQNTCSDEIIFNNRFFLPEKKETPYVYLFNYSIAENLIGTVYSRQLIKDFANTIESLKYKGLFCATVSDHGIRVAQKFGMKKAGLIVFEDDDEQDVVYAVRKQS